MRLEQLLDPVAAGADTRRRLSRGLVRVHRRLERLLGQHLHGDAPYRLTVLCPRPLRVPQDRDLETVQRVRRQRTLADDHGLEDATDDLVSRKARRQRLRGLVDEPVDVVLIDIDIHRITSSFSPFGLLHVPGDVDRDVDRRAAWVRRRRAVERGHERAGVPGVDHLAHLREQQPPRHGALDVVARSGQAHDASVGDPHGPVGRQEDVLHELHRLPGGVTVGRRRRRRLDDVLAGARRVHPKSLGAEAVFERLSDEAHSDRVFHGRTLPPPAVVREHALLAGVLQPGAADRLLPDAHRHLREVGRAPLASRGDHLDESACPESVLGVPRRVERRNRVRLGRRRGGGDGRGRTDPGGPCDPGGIGAGGFEVAERDAEADEREPGDAHGLQTIDRPQEGIRPELPPDDVQQPALGRCAQDRLAEAPADEVPVDDGPGARVVRQIERKRQRDHLSASPRAFTGMRSVQVDAAGDGHLRGVDVAHLDVVGGHEVRREQRVLHEADDRTAGGRRDRDAGDRHQRPDLGQRHPGGRVEVHLVAVEVRVVRRGCRQVEAEGQSVLHHAHAVAHQAVAVQRRLPAERHPVAVPERPQDGAPGGYADAGKGRRTLDAVLVDDVDRRAGREGRGAHDERDARVQVVPMDPLEHEHPVGDLARDPDLLERQRRVARDDRAGRQVRPLPEEVSADAPLLAAQPGLDR